MSNVRLQQIRLQGLVLGYVGLIQPDGALRKATEFIYFQYVLAKLVCARVVDAVDREKAGQLAMMKPGG